MAILRFVFYHSQKWHLLRWGDLADQLIRREGQSCDLTVKNCTDKSLILKQLVYMDWKLTGDSERK